MSEHLIYGTDGHLVYGTDGHLVREAATLPWANPLYSIMIDEHPYGANMVRFTDTQPDTTWGSGWITAGAAGTVTYYSTADIGSGIMGWLYYDLTNWRVLFAYYGGGTTVLDSDDQIVVPVETEVGGELVESVESQIWTYSAPSTIQMKTGDYA